MKQKHFLISLAVLATGISVSAQTKDNVKTTFQTSREWEAFHRQQGRCGDGVWSRGNPRTSHASCLSRTG